MSETLQKDNYILVGQGILELLIKTILDKNKNIQKQKHSIQTISYPMYVKFLILNHLGQSFFIYNIVPKLH